MAPGNLKGNCEMSSAQSSSFGGVCCVFSCAYVPAKTGVHRPERHSKASTMWRATQVGFTTSLAMRTQRRFSCAYVPAKTGVHRPERHSKASIMESNPSGLHNQPGHADTKKIVHLRSEARVTLGPNDWQLIRAYKPKSHIGIAAISNRSDLKSQSTSDIATKNRL